MSETASDSILRQVTEVLKKIETLHFPLEVLSNADVLYESRSRNLRKLSLRQYVYSLTEESPRSWYLLLMIALPEYVKRRRSQPNLEFRAFKKSFNSDKHAKRIPDSIPDYWPSEEQIKGLVEEIRSTAQTCLDLGGSSTVPDVRRQAKRILDLNLDFYTAGQPKEAFKNLLKVALYFRNIRDEVGRQSVLSWAKVATRTTGSELGEFEIPESAIEEYRDLFASYRRELQDPLSKHPSSKGRQLPLEILETAGETAQQRAKRELKRRMMERETMPDERSGQPQPLTQAESTASRGDQLAKGPSGTRAKTVGKRQSGIQTSRDRIQLLDRLTRELATVYQDVQTWTNLENLKAKFPDFKIWEMLSEQEQHELLDAEFKPKQRAEQLVLRHFGITSPDTLKKDRKKLRRGERQSP